YAGQSPLSLKIGIRIPVASTGLGIATSSGTVGHSYSFGKADAVTVVCGSAALADAAATAIGNLVTPSENWEWIESELKHFPFVEGVVIIAGKKMLVWGKIEIVSL
ncbi:MAG: UPF0280 family protein, partial [Candidatus Omnitrophica bacterium]|nr:UPF0280 family protein [Candidatus Omnitrophota bacterium]